MLIQYLQLTKEFILVSDTIKQYLKKVTFVFVNNEHNTLETFGNELKSNLIPLFGLRDLKHVEILATGCIRHFTPIINILQCLKIANQSIIDQSKTDKYKTREIANNDCSLIALTLILPMDCVWREYDLCTQFLNQETGLYSQCKEIFDMLYDLIEMAVPIYLEMQCGFDCHDITKGNQLVEKITDEIFWPFRHKLMSEETMEVGFDQPKRDERVAPRQHHPCFEFDDDCSENEDEDYGLTVYFQIRIVN